MRSFKLFLVVCLFFLGVETTLACSCAPPQSPAAELKKASAVFAGKVIEIKRQQREKGPKHPGDLFREIEVRLEVSKAWKGIDKDIAVVFTPAHSASCGYRFSKDKTYLVYAYENKEGKLETGICSRTKRLDDAEEETKELDQEIKENLEATFLHSLIVRPATTFWCNPIN